jgi:hypothetical protein
MEAVASLGEPDMVSCTGTDCEGDHLTYAPNNVVLVLAGVAEEKFDEKGLNATIETCIEKGTLHRGKTTVFPTVLGVWWDNTFEVHNQN